MSQEPPAQHQPPFDVPSVEEMNALLPQYAFEKLAAYGGMGAVFKVGSAAWTGRWPSKSCRRSLARSSDVRRALQERGPGDGKAQSHECGGGI
jgi:hypothetical protein